MRALGIWAVGLALLMGCGAPPPVQKTPAWRLEMDRLKAKVMDIDGPDPGELDPKPLTDAERKQLVILLDRAGQSAQAGMIEAAIDGDSARQSRALRGWFQVGPIGRKPPTLSDSGASEGSVGALRLAWWHAWTAENWAEAQIMAERWLLRAPDHADARIALALAVSSDPETEGPSRTQRLAEVLAPVIERMPTHAHARGMLAAAASLPISAQAHSKRGGLSLKSSELPKLAPDYAWARSIWDGKPRATPTVLGRRRRPLSKEYDRVDTVRWTDGLVVQAKRIPVEAPFLFMGAESVRLELDDRAVRPLGGAPSVVAGPPRAFESTQNPPLNRPLAAPPIERWAPRIEMGPEPSWPAPQITYTAQKAVAALCGAAPDADCPKRLFAAVARRVWPHRVEQPPSNAGVEGWITHRGWPNLVLADLLRTAGIKVEVIGEGRPVLRTPTGWMDIAAGRIGALAGDVRVLDPKAPRAEPLSVRADLVWTADQTSGALRIRGLGGVVEGLPATNAEARRWLQTWLPSIQIGTITLERGAHQIDLQTQIHWPVVTVGTCRIMDDFFPRPAGFTDSLGALSVAITAPSRRAPFQLPAVDEDLVVHLVVLEGWRASAAWDSVKFAERGMSLIQDRQSVGQTIVLHRRFYLDATSVPMPGHALLGLLPVTNIWPETLCIQRVENGR